MSYSTRPPTMEDMIMSQAGGYAFESMGNSYISPRMADIMQPMMRHAVSDSRNYLNSSIANSKNPITEMTLQSFDRVAFPSTDQDMSTSKANQVSSPSYGRVAFPSTDEDMPTSKSEQEMPLTYGGVAVFPGVEPPLDITTPLPELTKTSTTAQHHLQDDFDSKDFLSKTAHFIAPGPQNETKVIQQLLTSSLFQLCHNNLTFKDNVHISGELKFSVDADESIAICIDDNIEAIRNRSSEDDQVENSLDFVNQDDSRSMRSGNAQPSKRGSNKPFGCALCGKSFLTKAYVEKHIANHKRDVYITNNIVYHHGENPFKCEKCGEGFDDVKKLKQHVKTHPRPKGPRKPREKSQIDAFLEESDQLFNDTDINNIVLGNFVDPEEEEEEEEDEEEDFEPKGDGYRVSLRPRRRKLKRKTKRRGAPITNKPFGCGVCLKTFFTKSYLKKHISKHKGPDGKDIDISSNIIYYKGESPFKCKTCGEKFEMKSRWKIHIRTHTGERPYTCETCGKSFSTSSILKSHVLIHNPSLAKACKCPICNKGFLTNSRLNHHMKAHGEKTHCCDTCGKWFSRKRYLDIHTRTHTGEKPYTCNTCGKSFVATSNLYTHMRVHTGEKPYNCTVCGAKFAYKDGLVRHMAVHTGEKPPTRKRKAQRERPAIPGELPAFNEHSLSTVSQQSMDSLYHDPASRQSYQHTQSPAPMEFPGVQLQQHTQLQPQHQLQHHQPPHHHVQHQPQPHAIFPDRHEQIPPYAHQGGYPPKWGPAFLYQM